jgi:hypothetical protein
MVGLVVHVENTNLTNDDKTNMIDIWKSKVYTYTKQCKTMTEILQLIPMFLNFGGSSKIEIRGGIDQYNEIKMLRMGHFNNGTIEDFQTFMDRMKTKNLQEKKRAYITANYSQMTSRKKTQYISYGLNK